MGTVRVNMRNAIKQIRAIVKDERVIAEITRVCAEYGQRMLERAYEDKNFEDDTYNLRDSYCFAVFHNGKIVSKGFLGEAVATTQSKFHKQLIDGRQKAEQAINEYNSSVIGWEIIWVAAAPYSVCLEGVLYKNGIQYIVIGSIYDSVRGDFGNSSVKFTKITY